MIGQYMEWKVRFDRPVYRDGVDIWIYRHRNDHNEVLQPDGMIVKVAEGETTGHLRPTLSLNGGDSRQIMQEFMVALCEQGVRQPTDIRVQGLFDAQSRHLEDLRKLLKLNRGEPK